MSQDSILKDLHKLMDITDKLLDMIYDKQARCDWEAARFLRDLEDKYPKRR